VELRRATTEQAAATTQLTQATEAIRRGAMTTTKSVAEQATAAEQISKAAIDLSRQIGSVAKAMSEQAAAAVEMNGAVDSMRTQSEQAARAATEQARTMKDMARASNATARDIKLISAANNTHSQAAGRLASQVADIRRITERNAAGVKQTRGGTSDLLRQAEALSSLMSAATSSKPTNGRSR
jgi:methyl-accepting chemotaxis protein